METLEKYFQPLVKLTIQTPYDPVTPLLRTPPHTFLLMHTRMSQTFQSCLVAGQMYIPTVHQHINIQINKSIMIYSGIEIVGNNKK